MTKRSTIRFLIFIAFFVFVVISNNFLHYRVKKEYLEYGFVDCDPTFNKCFSVDPNNDANLSFGHGFYAKVEIMTYEAPKCLGEHSCTNFSCSGLSTCTITYCSNEALEDGEICSNSENI